MNSHRPSTFPSEARAQTLLATGSGGVNDETVNCTTILKAIPRASQHAAILVIHLLHGSILDMHATPFKIEDLSGERKAHQRRHVQHSTPNSTPA